MHDRPCPTIHRDNTMSRALSPLIVHRDSYSPWILARFDIDWTKHSLFLRLSFLICIYMYIILITIIICVMDFITSPIGMAVGHVYENVANFIFISVCRFDSTTVARHGEVSPFNLSLTTPIDDRCRHTDAPKSVSNRTFCVIAFLSVFMLL